MPASNDSFYMTSYRGRKDCITLTGRVTTTTSGTIGSQTAKKTSRFVVARTAAGKYSVTFNQRFAELVNFDVKIIGANATYTAAKGFQPYVATDQVAHANKQIIFHLHALNGGAIADVEDGAIMLITVVVARATS